MLIRLTNVLAIFQRHVNYILRNFLRIFIVVYLDDILIFLRTFNEHIKHVKIVLKKLKEYNL